MEEQERKQVFISYAKEDLTQAASICAYLEENGVRCWFAKRDNKGGIDYGMQIGLALEECRLVVLIFTEKANEAGGVRHELEMAFGDRKTIVPYRMEKDLKPGVKIRYYLAGAQYVEAGDGGGLYRLLCDVSSALGRPVPPPPAASSQALIICAVQDVPLAQKICEYMRAHGILCWYTPRNDTGAAIYDEKILRDISESRVVVVIISSSAGKSADVERELEIIHRNKAVTLPFLAQKKPSGYGHLGRYFQGGQFIRGTDEYALPYLRNSIYYRLHKTQMR